MDYAAARCCGIEQAFMNPSGALKWWAANLIFFYGIQVFEFCFFCYG